MTLDAAKREQALKLLAAIKRGVVLLEKTLVDEQPEPEHCTRPLAEAVQTRKVALGNEWSFAGAASGKNATHFTR